MPDTYRIFSDPHLGLTRSSHTTPASRARLRQSLYGATLAACSGTMPTLCLGDLFDTYDNDEATILQGWEIYQRCAKVLMGNHDLANRTDKLSSLQLLLSMGDSGEARPSLPFYAIDHCLSNTDFQGKLAEAAEQGAGYAALLLHCNYDSPFASQETTLNLTPEMAERLLGVFPYIFIGHEHEPATHFDGRLVLVGNTHPTSFADLGDKYVWDVTVETGTVTQVERHCVWRKDEHYLSVHADALAELSALDPAVQFVDVHGTVDKAKMPSVARAAANLWRLSDNLLMVRNSTSTDAADTLPETGSMGVASIPERISQDLKGTKLEPVWKAYLGRAEALDIL